MDGVWTTVMVGVAGPVGAVLILALAVVSAGALAERINPSAQEPAEEQVREAIERQRLQEQVDGMVSKAEESRGRIPVDSTHVSFPVFGTVFAAWLFLSAWGAAAEHASDPGAGFPLALALRPLWSALIAAFLAGVVAGFFYRRWFRRQTWQRRTEIRERLRAREQRDFQSRLRAIRQRGTRRTGSY